MKHSTRDELLNLPRPKCDPQALIWFCLDRLAEDRKHSLTQDIVRGCTFEDIITVINLARDLITNGGKTNNEQ